MTRLHGLGIAVLLMLAPGLGRPSSASLQFLVLKGEDGKPIRNAEIVLHALDKHGHQKSDGIELKTHADGKAEVDGIPYGKFRVQVIAAGFRTYGEDYDVTQ